VTGVRHRFSDTAGFEWQIVNGSENRQLFVVTFKEFRPESSEAAIPYGRGRVDWRWLGLAAVGWPRGQNRGQSAKTS
jgi:hypothetical protein